MWSCDFDLLTKNKNWHTRSLIRLSWWTKKPRYQSAAADTEQDPFPINQAKFHISKSIFTDFVFNWSLAKPILPNHMKASPIKAVIKLMLNTIGQHAIVITFVIKLTCFHIPWNHRFHNIQVWQPLKMEHNAHTHTHILTLTLMKTEQTVSSPLETQ